MGSWSKDPEDRIPAGRGTLRKLMPSGVWHLHYKSDRGIWVTRSTGHHDRTGAVKWAEAFSMNLTRSEFGLPDPERPKADDLIGPAIDEWLTYQKGQNKPYTHRSYRSIAAKFRKFLETRPPIKRLRDLTPEIMLEYRQWALDRGNAKVTVDNNLIALRSFFNWCRSLNKLAANPVSQQRHGVQIFFDEPTPRKEAYTKDEYRRIVKASPSDLRRVVILLGNLGLRISELAMLEWSDVDPIGQWLNVRVKKTHDGIDYRPKDDTDRKIPANNPEVEAVLSELATLTGRQGYILPLKKVKSRVDYAERSLLEKLKDAAGGLGIDPARLTLHNFRRYFVSECADRGVKMATVMKWVGHDEMKMVMYYYSLRDGSSQEAMRKFSEAEEEGTGADRAGVAKDGTKRARGGGRGRKRRHAELQADSKGGKRGRSQRQCGHIDQRRTAPRPLE
jgi:integrase